MQPPNHSVHKPACLISGSMAMDTIMHFPDRFSNHVLADKIDMLNVSFLVPKMQIEFGGCAGNIAYNMQMLGLQPRVCATVGKDAQAYIARFQSLGIATDYLHQSTNNYTARAFITTDIDNNQITAFHPGAMQEIAPLDVQGVQIALVGPASKKGMLTHIEQLHKAGISTIFDLGQAMPLFNGDELLSIIDKVDYLAANDYEAEVITRRTGLSLTQLAQKLQAMFITQGENGSCIYADSTQYTIEAIHVDNVLDPTGCGDAYRAGLLYGMCAGLDWQTTGRFASLVAAKKIASVGTQNHHYSLASLKQAYQHHFGVPLFRQS